MGDKRTVLVALDGSKNAAYALTCKYFLDLSVAWVYPREAMGA